MDKICKRCVYDSYLKCNFCEVTDKYWNKHIGEYVVPHLDQYKDRKNTDGNCADFKAKKPKWRV